MCLYRSLCIYSNNAKLSDLCFFRTTHKLDTTNATFGIKIVNILNFNLIITVIEIFGSEKRNATIKIEVFDIFIYTTI